MIAKTLFGLYLVAVGNGNVVHLVAETENEHILRICPCCGNTLPYGDFLLCLGVGPVADNHLAAQTHAGADVSEFAVAVSALVEVHEVHVDLVPGNLGIELGVEMQQRLGELLQAMNPHFSG